MPNESYAVMAKYQVPEERLVMVQVVTLPTSIIFENVPGAVP
jgi:hypothetical protein